MTLADLKIKYEMLKPYFSVIESLSPTQQEVLLKNFSELNPAMIKAESEYSSLQDRRVTGLSQAELETKITKLAVTFDSLSYKLVNALSQYILFSSVKLNTTTANSDVKTQAEQSKQSADVSPAISPSGTATAAATISSEPINGDSAVDVSDYEFIDSKSIPDVSLKAHERFKGHTSRITGISMIPEIDWVVTGSKDSSLRIWSPRGDCMNISVSSYVNNAKPNWYDVVGHGGKIIDTVRSQFHKVNCHVVLPIHEAVESSLPSNPKPQNIKYKVVFGLESGKLQIFPRDAETDKDLEFEQQQTVSAVTCLVAVSGQNKVISGAKDGTVRVWSVSDNGIKCMGVLTSPQNYPFGPVTGLAVLRDQETLISGAGDANALCIWSLKNSVKAEMIFSQYNPPLIWELSKRLEANRLHSFELTPDQNTVITIVDWSISFWSLQTRTQTHSVNARFNITCMTILSNTIAITGSAKGYISVWDLKKRETILERPLKLGAISCITRIPNRIEENSTPTFLVGLDSGNIVTHTIKEIRPKNRVFRSRFASAAYEDIATGAGQPANANTTTASAAVVNAISGADAATSHSNKTVDTGHSSSVAILHGFINQQTINATASTSPTTTKVEQPNHKEGEPNQKKHSFQGATAVKK